tara:strand:- start:456 stop:812 length:357 start_codon:yes stop_codon:yes gene_type:complete
VAEHHLTQPEYALVPAILIANRRVPMLELRLMTLPVQSILYTSINVGAMQPPLMIAGQKHPPAVRRCFPDLGKNPVVGLILFNAVNVFYVSMLGCPRHFHAVAQMHNAIRLFLGNLPA